MQNCRIIDLTKPISEKTEVFPGDPSPKFPTIATYEKDGYYYRLMQITEHTGTHIDAPLHFYPNGSDVTQIPIEILIGKALILDEREKERITKEDILEALNNREITILGFFTGYEWTDNICSNIIQLDPEAAKAIAQSHINIVLFDSPSPDCEPYEAHRILLGNNKLIVENVENLDKLIGKKPTIIVAPLVIVGGSGSPVRLLAIECEDSET